MLYIFPNLDSKSLHSGFESSVVILTAIYHIYFVYNFDALFSLSPASYASIFDYCQNL